MKGKNLQKLYLSKRICIIVSFRVYVIYDVEYDQ